VSKVLYMLDLAKVSCSPELNYSWKKLRAWRTSPLLYC